MKPAKFPTFFSSKRDILAHTSHKYGQLPLIVRGIFAKIGPDLELRWGDLISSPVDSIVGNSTVEVHLLTLF